MQPVSNLFFCMRHSADLLCSRHDEACLHITCFLHVHSALAGAADHLCFVVLRVWYSHWLESAASGRRCWQTPTSEEPSLFESVLTGSQSPTVLLQADLCSEGGAGVSPDPG